MSNGALVTTDQSSALKAALAESTGIVGGVLGYLLSMAKDHGAQIKKDEQYEALRDKGMSKNKAARIANADAQGGGSNQASKKGGKSSKYEDKTKSELMEQAKKVGIEGRSKMDKGELIDALRNH